MTFLDGGVVVGVTDLTIATSPFEVTVTVSLLLLDVFVSLPPPVTPVLTIVSGALSSTLTTTLTGS